MLFALTDFLVVLGCGLGIWRLWPHRRKGDVRMVRLGLAFVGLAALLGTLRFATGQVEALAQAHSLASQFAGAAGMLLIALGVAWEGIPIRLSPGIGRYLRVGIPVFVAIALFWPGSEGLVALLPQAALLLGIFASLALLWHRCWQVGALWLAVWVLLAVDSTFIGGSREITTFGIAHWHIYHTLLGLWGVLTGEAMRRTIARRA